MNLGGKLNNLAWLKENKFKVPSFVAVNEAEFLSNEQILKSTKSLKFPVAVRSSFLGEDGQNFSFAGLFETILHVKNNEELLNAVKNVAVSLNSPRVDEYCAFHKIQKPTWGSVVVQEMVPSKIAGVVFSTSPLRPECVHISSAYGYGDKLVSGESDSDEYFIKKINPEFQTMGSLSVAQQKEIYTHALKIAALKKTAQDIEWSIDQNDVLHFLQTRQITAQIKKIEQPIYFDNSNIQESFVGITLPLTFSYARNAYRQSYNTLMRIVGFDEVTVQKNNWRHQHMLGIVDGHIYYNINSWYEGLLFLPHFGKNKKDMENMMGLEKSIDFIETHHLTVFEKIKKIPAMLKLLCKVSYQFFTIKESVHKFDTDFQNMTSEHRKTDLNQLSPIELHNYLIDLQEKGFALWGIPLVNDFYVMMNSGKVRRILSKNNKDSSYPRLIKSTELESFKPISELQGLLKELQKSQILLKALENNPNEFLPTCKIENPELYKMIFEYIDMYGDRVLGELKLETKTYRTNPELFVKTLKLFNASSRKDYSAAHADDTDLNVALQGLSFFEKRSLKANLKKLQNGLQYRELMRFHRTRSFGMVREIYLKLAEKFVQIGFILEKEDLFYLTMEEISDIATFQNVQSDFKGLIALRKKEYSRYFSDPKYKNQLRMKIPLTDSDKIENSDLSTEFNGSELKGTGCFPGIFEGEICYIKNIDEAHNLHGKILLAERTDPGWTPLFYLAKAVIVEKGSLLSHAAIVAREVGIPTIIGVPRATQILKSGDKVTVDGSEGTILRSVSKS